jgi:hypothetical protein
MAALHDAYINGDDASMMSLVEILTEPEMPVSTSAKALAAALGLRQNTFYAVARRLGRRLPERPRGSVGVPECDLIRLWHAYHDTPVEVVEAADNDADLAELQNMPVLLNSLRAATVVLRAALDGEDDRALPAPVAGAGAEVGAVFDQGGGEALGPLVPGEQVGTALQQEGDRALAPLADGTLERWLLALGGGQRDALLPDLAG